jgi:acylphosphatase
VPEEAATDQEQREVYYSGTVQGVGFRYTVRGVASSFDVTGFVKNLPDGRVQLVAEGHPAEVQRFLDAVEAEMGRYVTRSQQQVAAATGRFDGFRIRF